MSVLVSGLHLTYSTAPLLLKLLYIMKYCNCLSPQAEIHASQMNSVENNAS